MLLAKLPKLEKGFSYKLLLMKRSAKSKFMANAAVFPGGVCDKSDFSSDWETILFKYGQQTKRLLENRVRPPMFLDPEHSGLNPELGYRISAVRETFEESGIPLFKTIGAGQLDDNEGPDDILKKMGDKTLSEWRQKIEKDGSLLMEMCSELGLVPDIWSLHTWSNWLTPTHMQSMHGKSPRRYDTIFYVRCLPYTPKHLHDDRELVSSEASTLPFWREMNCFGERAGQGKDREQMFFIALDWEKLENLQCLRLGILTDMGGPELALLLEVDLAGFCLLVNKSWTEIASSSPRKSLVLRQSPVFHLAPLSTEQWHVPTDGLEMNYREETWLAPPQVYELSRLCGMKDFATVSKRSEETSQTGCERLFPIRFNCEDGVITTLPGKERDKRYSFWIFETEHVKIISRCHSCSNLLKHRRKITWRKVVNRLKVGPERNFAVFGQDSVVSRNLISPKPWGNTFSASFCRRQFVSRRSGLCWRERRSRDCKHNESIKNFSFKTASVGIQIKVWRGCFLQLQTAVQSTFSFSGTRVQRLPGKFSFLTSNCGVFYDFCLTVFPGGLQNVGRIRRQNGTVSSFGPNLQSFLQQKFAQFISEQHTRIVPLWICFIVDEKVMWPWRAELLPLMWFNCGSVQFLNVTINVCQRNGWLVVEENTYA